jgi:short-subunit dehydrogenase
MLGGGGKLMVTRSPNQKGRDTGRQLAVITGASTGIGYELARCCAAAAYDLVIAADEPQIRTAAESLAAIGVEVTAVETNLATIEGVDELCSVFEGRRVDVLLANAGRGLGKAFLDQNFGDIRHVIDTNITGTVYLIHKVGQQMRMDGKRRILITGSIAGFMPGTYQAVYNGTKAFLDNFSFALRAELKNSGVTVTCLMPGATETEFFERADLMDTKIGQRKKMDPSEVAMQGFDAMMNGDGEGVTGWMNKMRTAISSITPSGILAEAHRSMTEPGSAHKK